MDMTLSCYIGPWSPLGSLNLRTPRCSSCRHPFFRPSRTQTATVSSPVALFSKWYPLSQSACCFQSIDPFHSVIVIPPSQSSPFHLFFRDRPFRDSTGPGRRIQFVIGFGPSSHEVSLSPPVSAVPFPFVHLKLRCGKMRHVLRACSF